MSRVLIFALLLILASSFELCSDNVSELNTQSDNFKWPQYEKNLLYETQYHEWWFFTFFDEANDIGMAFSYGLSDPEDINKGSCGITNMVWTHVLSEQIQEPQMFISDFNFVNCSFSVEKADVGFPTGGIKVSEDGKTYNVQMKLENLTLDLNYTQLVAPCRQTEEFAPFAVIDWQAYMISAKVVGTVTLNNVTYNITGRGYHDKNWGSWPSSKFNWVWSQYNDPDQGLGIVWGSYKVPLVDKYIGYMFLRIQNEEHTIIQKLGTLCLDEFSLNVLENSTDVYGVNYASHIQVTAKQLIFGNLKVVLDINKKVAFQNPGGIALDLRVFEMISKYNVQVYQGDNLLIDSSGYGFNEWSEIINSSGM